MWTFVSLIDGRRETLLRGRWLGSQSVTSL